MILSITTGYSVFAETVKIDTNHSKIEWMGGKKLLNDTHKGTLLFKSGTLVFKNNALVSGELNVDMHSLKNTDIENPKYKQKLVGHLKNSDFFHVEKYPKATFKFDTVKKLKNNQYKLTGLMKIKNKTNKETVTITLKKQKKTWSGSGKITIDRSKYDVRYGSDSFFDNLGDKVIKNEIELTLDVKTKAS